MDNHIAIICQNGKGGCYFYKNNVLHREAGPAVLEKLTKSEFDKLEDKELYQEKIIQEKLPPGYQVSFLMDPPSVYDNSGFAGSIIDAIYYLDGQAYPSDEFKEVKAKLDLRKELHTELTSSQHSSKRAKV